MERIFPKALAKCQEKYEKRALQYGDSWKQLPRDQLRFQLGNEIEEFCGAESGTSDEIDEICDIINQGLMLLERLVGNNAVKPG